ncbi:IS1 family transposase [Xenorhabdus cabanillasii]|uniref:IS1 family transposase n=1 Tax=Xenorhabdus cabanillasii TaxID=351673 RepID=UPI000A06E58D
MLYQRIERMDLTNHTQIKRLNRKTIGYSRCKKIHNKGIGIFIELDRFPNYATEFGGHGSFKCSNML